MVLTLWINLENASTLLILPRGVGAEPELGVRRSLVDRRNAPCRQGIASDAGVGASYSPIVLLYRGLELVHPALTAAHDGGRRVLFAQLLRATGLPNRTSLSFEVSAEFCTASH